MTLSTAADACEPVGGQVVTTATLSGPRGAWVAGQMLLQWDPSKLALKGVQPGGGPYTVAYSLNPAAGSATILSSIEPGSEPPMPTGQLTCDTPWKLVASSAPGAYEIAYDTNRRRTVLVSDGKTWEWDGLAWSLRSTSGPPARGAGALVYDPNGKRCLLFGGYGGNPVHSDLWSWDGNTWTFLNSGQIPGRGDFAMAFDANRNRLVVHGGYNTSTLMSDTCEWNPTSNTWRRVTGGSVGNLYAHRMAYDEGLKSVMMHGGFNFFNRSDTWTWNGTSWSRIATNGPARYVFGMAYDSRRGEMVIHGGTTCCYEVEYPETYRFRGGSWQLCGTTGPARGYMGMAYDSHRDALIFSGGMGPSPAGRIGFAETWELRAQETPTDVVKLSFEVLGASCAGTGNEVSFFAMGPMQTVFTDGFGGSVAPTLLGSSGFVVDDGKPVLSNVPADVSVQAFAGDSGFASVTLGTPTATDACAPGLTATGVRSDGRALSAAWPSGTTTVTWTATDPCGNTATATTRVTVDPTNTMDLAANLVSPFGFSDPYGGGGASRTLTVSAKGTAGVVSRTPSVFVGRDGAARFSITDLPADAYGCVVIEHVPNSLRARVSVSDTGSAWTADTATLVLGDVIDDEVIDVLDWGAYIVRNPNADLNADGFIGTDDGSVILANFGRKGDTACTSSLTGPREPLTEVSVSDLVSMGMPELAGADLNGDGMLDAADMEFAGN